MRLPNPLSKEPTKCLETRLWKRDCEMSQLELFCRPIKEGAPVSYTLFVYNKPFPHQYYQIRSVYTELNIDCRLSVLNIMNTDYFFDAGKDSVKNKELRCL
jgi:hypothetical protein